MSNPFKKQPIIVDADETWEEQADRQHRQIEEKVAAMNAKSELRVKMLSDRVEEEHEKWLAESQECMKRWGVK